MNAANTIYLFVPAAISALIGFGIAYYILKWLKKSYTKKTQAILLLVLMISVGIGISGIINEIIIFQLFGLRARMDKVAQFFFANILIIPFVLWIVVRLMGKAIEPKVRREEKISEDHQKTPAASKSMATRSTEIINEGRLNELSSNNEPSKIKLEFWEKALGEYQSDARHKGLWAKLFSESNGNESVTKAQYIKLRALEISEAEGSTITAGKMRRPCLITSSPSVIENALKAMRLAKRI